MVNYSDFQECSFRGIPFPVITVNENGSQDLAIHKKTDRNGARVEGTGLNPFIFSLSIPTIEKIRSAKNETWSNLYPSTFLKLREAFKDRSTGIFVHPLYGQIKVKPQTWNSQLSSDIRGGQFIEIVFIETTEDDDQLNTAPNPWSNAKSAAINLDTNIATLIPPISFFTTRDESNSFEDFVNSLTSVVDAGLLAKQKMVSKVDSMVQKLNKIQSYISIVSTVNVKDDVTNTVTNIGLLGNGIVNITNDATKLSLSLIDLRQKILAEDKQISLYSVPKAQTLTLISITLKNSIKELLDLNPEIGRQVIIPQYTLIKSYTR